LLLKSYRNPDITITKGDEKMPGYNFTDHFLRRMNERKITPVEVAETLRWGVRKVGVSDGAVKCMYDGIHLILKGKNSLVTIYRVFHKKTEKIYHDGRTSRIRLRKKKEALQLSDHLEMMRHSNYRVLMED
jgi:hypothetical protein